MYPGTHLVCHTFFFQPFQDIFAVWLLVTSKELQGDKLHSLVGRELPQQLQQRGMTSFTASPAKWKRKTKWINGSRNPVLQCGTGSWGSVGFAAAGYGEPACGFSSSAQSQLKVTLDCCFPSTLMGTDCPTTGIGACSGGGDQKGIVFNIHLH